MWSKDSAQNSKGPTAQPCRDLKKNDSLSNNSCKYFLFLPPILLFSFFSLTKGHGLEACFYVQLFFHALKIAALISLIVNMQAVPAKQSGPLESVNACD